jgi:hypothetical protein
LISDNVDVASPMEDAAMVEGIDCLISSQSTRLFRLVAYIWLNDAAIFASSGADPRHGAVEGELESPVPVHLIVSTTTAAPVAALLLALHMRNWAANDHDVIAGHG